MKDPRRLPYRIPSSLVPEELLLLDFVCARCGISFKHDWGRRPSPTAYPSAPIARGDNYLVQVAISVTCTSGHVTQVTVPIVPTAGSIRLFGDDASRDISHVGQRIQLRSTALVALATGPRRQSFLGKFLCLKEAVKSDFDPRSWSLHFTDFWSNKRDFSDLRISRAAKYKFAFDIADLISAHRPQLMSIQHHSMIITESGRRPATLKFQRESDFASVLVGSLQLLRSQQAVPLWSFDFDTATGTGNRTPEGDLDEVFLGLQYLDVWTWLCGGALVLAPARVEPGSDPMSEIADFLAFWSAREFAEGFEGKESVVLTRVGTGHHSWVEPGGAERSEWMSTLPMNAFGLPISR